MAQLPRPLRDGVDYLVTDPAPVIERGYDTISIGSYCVQIWPVDADADHRVYLCTTCKQFTATLPGAITDHQSTHEAQAKQMSLVLEAWELLPKAIRDQLLKRARDARRAAKDGG